MQGIWPSLGAEQSPHTECATASNQAGQVCTTPSPADIALRRLADAFGAQPKAAHSSIKPSRRTHAAPSLLQQPWLIALALCAKLAAGAVLQTSPDEPFHWTAPTVVLAVALFLVAGLCEIGGGWLVWQVYTPPTTAIPRHCPSAIKFHTSRHLFHRPRIARLRCQPDSYLDDHERTNRPQRQAALPPASVLFLRLQAVREGKSALWGAAGAVILIAYGFVPTAQPILNFGRIYAGEQSGIQHQRSDALGMPIGSPSFI